MEAETDMGAAVSPPAAANAALANAETAPPSPAAPPTHAAAPARPQWGPLHEGAFGDVEPRATLADWAADWAAATVDAAVARHAEGRPPVNAAPLNDLRDLSAMTEYRRWTRRDLLAADDQVLPYPRPADDGRLRPYRRLVVRRPTL